MGKTKKKTAPILDSEQFVDRIYNSIRGSGNERFCFILGSGACKTSGIPSGDTLEYAWMQELMGETPVNGRKLDPSRTKELAQRFWGDNSKFDKIVEEWEKKKSSEKTSLDGEFYFDIFDLREFVTQQNGQRLLEDILERDEVFPSYGYITLAKLLADGSGSNLVLTTNFDNLVERALNMYTDAIPVTINHEALAAFIDEPNLKRPLIGKIHRGSCFGMLNKPQEVDKLQGNWTKILNDIFLTYTPVVIGYSGNDKSLMSYLEKPRLKHGIIWCAYKEDPISDRIQNAVVKNKGCFVLHSGFDDLMTKVGNSVFEDEVMPQRVFDKLKKRTDDYCERLIKSYNDFTGSNEDNSDGSPDLPTHDPSGLGNSSESPKTPESSAAAELGRRTEEEDAKRKKEGALTAMDYFFQARMLANRKDYDGAIDNYTKAINLDPKNVGFYINRGYVYYKKGDYPQAIKDCTKAIELDPKNAAAYINRGYVYYKKGEYIQAIADCTKAIEIDPKLATAYNNRGAAYKNKGEYNEAIADFTRAIELDPKYAKAYSNRGYAYSNKGEYDEAIADCTKAIELDPKYAAAYNNRGAAYNHKGEYDKAITDCTRAIELDPKYAKAYNNRGNAYNNKGEYDKAAADFEKARELDPNLPKK